LLPDTQAPPASGRRARPGLARQDEDTCIEHRFRNCIPALHTSAGRTPAAPGGTAGAKLTRQLPTMPSAPTDISMPGQADATQRVVKIRRDYNTWVANETLEDYALRFTPRSFRKWSELRVANTALGAASFLVLEAVGGTITINYGFINAFWAILAVGLIIFLTGLPISYYAAKYGVDMDLLTRGAGFGYIGSTISSFVYASYTFILFALEAAIMAYALEMYFHIPLYLAYLLCALVVIPLVTHGITLISRIQLVTQPLWLVLMVLPLAMVLHREPHLLSELLDFEGKAGSAAFNIYLFGAAMAVGIALIPQIGEQVDFLRFMPEKTPQSRLRWHAGVLGAGPGWVLIGVLKMLAGGMLAYLATRFGLGWGTANNPTQMYLLGYTYVFDDMGWVMAATVLFVCISQIKINMTNAYAGSLAWSNFFARLTHSHPGRVVWLVFNTLIAVMLMQLDLFYALEQVLGLYANIAISWIAVVVADLVINKPLGLSPPGIEFKRAYLYDINPVGVGAMALASILSISAFFGAFGAAAQAFSAFIALLTAMIASPLIAWYTGGKYYIARKPERLTPAAAVLRCCICEMEYEPEDMAHCTAYQGPICSLCCTLDARCNDLCKPDGARVGNQALQLMRRLLPRSLSRPLETGLGHYLLLMAVIVALLAAALGLIYYHQIILLKDMALHLPQIQLLFLKIFAVLVFLSGIVAWWLILTSESRRVAQEESNRQTHLLMQEIESHHRTDEQLQKATRQADQANQAKSRYITTISHELRTPLNSILGYAQILDADASIPAHRRQAVRVIRRSGDHLLSLIENTLDIAHIESGRLKLDVRPLQFADFIQQIVRMFELQSQNKGLDFRYRAEEGLPLAVRADKRRLGQILINLLGNAFKFTERGQVIFRVKYAREMAIFEIEDSGPGIPAEEIEHIFEPFTRGSTTTSGTGLGLTISKMLTDLMGGDLSVRSTVGAGSIFQVRLFLPEVRVFTPADEVPRARDRIGYVGERRRILIVDNEKVDRELLASILGPLGFELREAESGTDCLKLLNVFEPHLILMDLAMPGIDGWETIRRIRGQQSSRSRIAIVSANAFDKGLENDVGIATEDFILKPVQVDEFLDWIGLNLDISWLYHEPPPPLPASACADVNALDYPSAQMLQELDELISIGYIRGILNKVEEIESQEAIHAEFTLQVRRLVEQFQLGALSRLVKEGLSSAEKQT
jgi:signal transduction histidine kinase/purine-cytosine permease-like protein/ActR/RegA family two-component response regulator